MSATAVSVKFVILMACRNAILHFPADHTDTLYPLIPICLLIDMEDVPLDSRPMSMIGATTLFMDVIPDEEDDLTMASPHCNSLANKTAEDTVSCKYNSDNIKLCNKRFRIKDACFLPSVHWLSLHESNEGIPTIYCTTISNGKSQFG